jgi:hypothetical protein
MQQNSNVIEFYDYKDVSRLYKQLRKQKIIDTANAFVSWINSYKVKQKIVGSVLIIFLTLASLIIKDPTALIFLLPMCIGVMFCKESES